MIEDVTMVAGFKVYNDEVLVICKKKNVDLRSALSFLDRKGYICIHCVRKVTVHFSNNFFNVMLMCNVNLNTQ